MNNTSAGEYTIKTKGFWSNEFSLELVPNRINPSYENNISGQMGEMTFVSDKFGVCKGPYKLAKDDETFDMDVNVIESVNGIYCSKLQNREYKWITVVIAFPVDSELNETVGPTKGKIAIRYKGKEILYKKMNMTLIQ